MPASTTAARRPRKAIILAAGKDDAGSRGRGARPLLLERLGDEWIVLELVADNVCQLMAPEDVYVVVGRRQEALFGPSWGPVHIRPPGRARGTGHAVLQVRPLLDGFDGDLLILYGDTPLFRPASIRGLLNRHRLGRRPDPADRRRRPALPYGRIMRDRAGQILDIIEAPTPRRRVGDPRAQRGRLRRPRPTSSVQTLDAPSPPTASTG